MKSTSPCRATPKTVQNLQTKDIRAMVDLTGVGAARDLRKRIEVSIPAGVTSHARGAGRGAGHLPRRTADPAFPV